jgi:hypothetical protein
MKSVRVSQRIVFRRPVIVAKRLLIDVAEEVKRLNRNVGSADPAL